VENLFEDLMTLRYIVKNQSRIIDEFKSGKRYLKLQEDFRRVSKGYIKEIQRLRYENSVAHARAITTRDIWTEECDEIWKNHLKEMKKKDAVIHNLEDRIWALTRKSDEKIAKLTENYEDIILEKDKIIDELKSQLAHTEALLDRDGTNTNLPTSQTPPGKKKHIPCSRRSSGKKKGGQPGHERHLLEKPSPDEITDMVDHELDENFYCPSCGSDDWTCTGEYEERYEYEVEVNVKKILHKFWMYRCDECGEILWSGTTPNLQAECQYGPNVQAMALSLMNTTNAAINKVPMFLSGITNGEICPSEGYIAKLQKRAATRLEPFMHGLFKELISRSLICWDDTVIMINKERGCLRFYGDDDIAYFVAHEKKDLDGVIEDGVLDSLSNQAVVMHDHSSISYNDRFIFINVECNAHLQRDLQKIVDETGHEEPAEFKELISETIKDRNDLLAQGKKGFGKRYIKQFERKISDILDRWRETANNNESKYSGPLERAVLNRFPKYQENYFAWVKDFSIPTTNNLSERSLRCSKTKMKVSGQFANVRTASYYAVIKSYTETCRRNRINEMEALMRLCAGNPFTVEEIFSTG